MKEKDKEFLDQMAQRGVVPVVGDINKEMVEVVQSAFSVFYLRRTKKITVFISSFGGSCQCGLEIYDLLRLYPGEVVGLVAGKAMSAASYILQGCQQRQATSNSLILIHNGRREVDNDILLDGEKIEEFLKENKRVRDRIHLLLAKATHKSVEEIAAECKRDRSMDVEQAIKFGLLDGIWDKPLPWNPAEELNK